MKSKKVSTGLSFIELTYITYLSYVMYVTAESDLLYQVLLGM